MHNLGGDHSNHLKIAVKMQNTVVICITVVHGIAMFYIT
jgi:hypothetical protein